MELANKTLYLVEELPVGRIHSSLLKMVASQDTIRGRQLYKGESDIELVGKLIINANSAPELGEEGPVWDRAVYIPWDTRYVQAGDLVDVANFRLPSDNVKKGRLVKMTDAFVTVCLKELHLFLNAPGNRDQCTGEVLVTELPQPDCVRELVAKEKERGFPLKMFVKQYIKESVHGNRDEVTIEVMFHAYRGFLKSRNIRSQDTMDMIVEKFPRVGLVAGFDTHGEACVKGQYITDAGAQMAVAASRGMGFEELLPSAYPINRAFNREEKNNLDGFDGLLSSSYPIDDAFDDHSDQKHDIDTDLIGAGENHSRPNVESNPELLPPPKRPCQRTVQCQVCQVRSPPDLNWRCPSCNGRLFF